MHYGWVLVAACVTISAYYSGVVYLGFTAAFEPLVKEFGWSYTQISFVSSLRGMETGLLVPVAGILMDRWGPRRLVLGGALIAGVGLICLSRTNTLLTFYASFILIAAGLSSATTSLLMAAVTSWFKKNVGLATGITASGVAAGGLLIPIITHMIDSMGWREAMFWMGIGMWILPMPMALLLRHRPEQYGYHADGVKISASDAKATSTEKRTNVGVRQALKNPMFWVVSLTFLCQVLPLSAIVTHIMPFFTSVGADRTTASLIASSLPIMTVVGRIGFGWLGDRVGNKTMAVLAFTLSALGPFLLAFVSAETMWLAFPFIIIFGIGWGGGVPMLNGLMRDYFGTRNLASIIGFSGSLLMVGMMIGAPLAGWIYDSSGSYRTAWFLLGGITAIATVLFYKFARKPDKAAAPLTP